MTWRRALAPAVVLVAAWVTTTAAQETLPPADAVLELRRTELTHVERGRRAVVRPGIREDAAVRDAERAAAALEEAERDERLVREATRLAPRRPDLQHDVIQGIQQRAVHRARGR